ncbi:uncharacterized protein [Lepeophtheirus salmonis]|uniref:uncharacterized protein n=1 Tax=Lepeophtheirus salmonis TaxID=72036 RepID=UPI001AE2D37A|nr:uncharacterized protein LOC121131480 [Lepeophtheirus salmonis]
MGNNTFQAQVWIEKYYPDSAQTKTTIKRCFADFKRGRTDTNDTESSGRPNQGVIPEAKIIMDNHKVKMQEIGYTLKLSKGSVYTITNKDFGMENMFSKWFPRLLTPEQNQQP